MTDREDDALARLDELEQRIEVLERARRTASTQTGLEGEQPGPDTFWALDGLLDRLADDAGAVLFTGVVPLPTGERFVWQQAADGTELLESDWTELSASLSALGHPVRLGLLRRILSGARTVAELQNAADLGTSGQLYHHLRQLVSAGWLQATSRGRYAVPGRRVIPLLVILAAAQR